MEETKSLEKLDSKKKTLISNSDITYDKLQSLEEDFSKPTSSFNNNFQKMNDSEGENVGFELIKLENNEDKQQKKDLVIETQNFLASNYENLINTKHDSPFKTVKKFLSFWTILSIFLAAVIIIYFIFNIWVTTIILEKNQSSNIDLNQPSLTFKEKLVNYYSKKENMLFGDYYANFFMSVAGLMLILYSTIILIIENKFLENWRRPIHKEILKYIYIIYQGTYFFGTFIQIKIYNYERDYKEMSDTKIEDDDKRNYNDWKYFFIFLVILCFIVKLAFCYGHFLCYRTCEKMKIEKINMLEDILKRNKFEDEEQKQDVIKN